MSPFSFFSVLPSPNPPPSCHLTCLFLKNFYFLILFLERGEERETERERNINVWLPLEHPLLGTWPATQACALIGNQTSDPLVLRLALNPLSHTSQRHLMCFLEYLLYTTTVLGAGDRVVNNTDIVTGKVAPIRVV